MLARLRRTPYRPLIPWVLLTVLLGAGVVLVHLLVVMPAHARLDQAEASWRAARDKAAQRLDARAARKDLALVMNALPAHRDFVQLPFALTQVAQRDRVTMPGLSSSLEKAAGDRFQAAMLRGAVTGRYEDLRRFIHHLERTDGFLFIDSLDVSQSNKKAGTVTFNLTVRTYIRDGQGPSVPVPAVTP